MADAHVSEAYAEVTFPQKAYARPPTSEGARIVQTPKPTKKPPIKIGGDWQGRRDSNTQPMVLETTTLPLSHTPKYKVYYIMKYYKNQYFYSNLL